jgi:hypothetical protein
MDKAIRTLLGDRMAYDNKDDETNPAWLTITLVLVALAICLVLMYWPE